MDNTEAEAHANVFLARDFDRPRQADDVALTNALRSMALSDHAASHSWENVALMQAVRSIKNGRSLSRLRPSGWSMDRKPSQTLWRSAYVFVSNHGKSSTKTKPVLLLQELTNCRYLQFSPFTPINPWCGASDASGSDTGDAFLAGQAGAFKNGCPMKRVGGPRRGHTKGIERSDPW